MNIVKEVWKPIKGYENYYSISNLGNVRNDKTHRILQGDCNTVGYKRVILYVPIKKRFFVHRLVAYHFVDGYSNEFVVNHKNGDKKDNRAENLEWVSRSENDFHAFRNDLRHIVIKSCSRGYFYSDWKHKRGKIGIRRVFVKSNAKCVTTIERILAAQGIQLATD